MTYTRPDGSRTPQAPLHWPFGQLTPMQQARVQRQLDALRRGELARWPAARW